MSWAPVLGAGIAAFAALIGYLSTYRTKRMDQKAEVYAKAVAAVSAYKHLPYRIRRRAAESTEIRNELGKLSSDVHQELTYYRSLLALDSELVATAYEKLVKAVYEKGKEHRDEAWKSPPATSDSHMTQIGTYDGGGREELQKCLNAMRQELGKAPIQHKPRR